MRWMLFSELSNLMRRFNDLTKVESALENLLGDVSSHEVNLLSENPIICEKTATHRLRRYSQLGIQFPKIANRSLIELYRQ